MSQLQAEQLVDADRIGYLADLVVELVADTNPLSIENSQLLRRRNINLSGMSMMLGISWANLPFELEDCSYEIGEKMLTLHVPIPDRSLNAGNEGTGPRNRASFVRELVVDNRITPEVWTYNEYILSTHHYLHNVKPPEVNLELIGGNLEYTDEIHEMFYQAIRWADCIAYIRQH